MIRYQHYSFDLWLTLIKSNPLFKQERARFFYDHFNRHQVTQEEVNRIFRKVDLMCNAINEKTGGNIDAEEMYLMVISEMNNNDNSFGDVDLPGLYREMEALVMKYLPMVYCSATISTLKQLRERGDTSISLLSNTAFIKGSTLRQVLQQLGLYSFFDFQLYSDETGMSKPNEAVFRLMLENVTALRKTDIIALKQIVHIGDNEKADIYGAGRIGIDTWLINSNNKCISSILN